MRGKIFAISKDVGAGLIKTGSDQKYLFSLKEWASEALPVNGQNVEFEISGAQTAVKVQLI